MTDSIIKCENCRYYVAAHSEDYVLPKLFGGLDKHTAMIGDRCHKYPHTAELTNTDACGQWKSNTSDLDFDAAWERENIK